jgi:hypothetical protein
LKGQDFIAYVMHKKARTKELKAARHKTEKQRKQDNAKMVKKAAQVEKAKQAEEKQAHKEKKRNKRHGAREDDESVQTTMSVRHQFFKKNFATIVAEKPELKSQGERFKYLAGLWAASDERQEALRFAAAAKQASKKRGGAQAASAAGAARA